MKTETYARLKKIKDSMRIDRLSMTCHKYDGRRY